MRYLTARKRAEGKGASGSGTEHFWFMQTTAVGLAILMPWVVVMLGRAIRSDYGNAWYILMNPWVSIPLALALFVGMRHFAAGARIMIEDYTRGIWRKGLIITVTSLSYLITAIGLYALVVISLKG
jgi:succinate dehydrogenase / fumarate reductase membrane anchor subunit